MWCEKKVTTVLWMKEEITWFYTEIASSCVIYFLHPCQVLHMPPSIFHISSSSAKIKIKYTLRFPFFFYLFLFLRYRYLDETSAIALSGCLHYRYSDIFITRLIINHRRLIDWWVKCLSLRAFSKFVSLHLTVFCMHLMCIKKIVMVTLITALLSSQVRLVRIVYILTSWLRWYCSLGGWTYMKEVMVGLCGGSLKCPKELLQQRILSKARTIQRSWGSFYKEILYTVCYCSQSFLKCKIYK